MKAIAIHRLAILSAIMLVVFACAPAAGAQAAIPSTPAAGYQADVATVWFDFQLQLVKQTPGFSPPVASRAFGYSGVTLYETVVHGMPGYQSLAGQLNELNDAIQPESEAEYHWPTAANSALAMITRLLFAAAPEESQAKIDLLHDQLAQKYRTDVDAGVFDRSKAYGEAVAAAIFEWSTTDGGHEGYLRSFPTDYVAPVDVGLWVPTPRLDGDPQPALQPYWGDNRTFLPDSDDLCMPPVPPAYSESAQSVFYTEALEVYQTVQDQTQEQTDIALFWSDDPGRTATPPGHTVSILTQILREEEASLSFAAEAYAKLGIAVADAFIGCWKAKFHYNFPRPVTYIQQVMDASWMPVLNTPPFPEYPSGHSVQIGAAAIVLEGLFGAEYHFTDHTHDSLGYEARSFNSFDAMADEAALSRLYGGIHFRSAIELGIDQGHCIGQKVDALVFQPSS